MNFDYKNFKPSTWIFIAAGVWLALDVIAGYTADKATNPPTMPGWYSATIGNVDTIAGIPTYVILAGAGAVTRFVLHK